MLKPKEKAVMDLIAKDVAYENYFFNKVEKLKWFYPLKERGYFKPERSPQPRETDKSGYYRVPEWNILGYFERISTMKSHSEYDTYIDEILEIIFDVSTYKDDKGKHIENYRTWWYFAKILVNIPNEKITLEILDLISIWLDSKFDNSLVSSEIIDNLIAKFLSENISESDIEKAEKIIDKLTNLKKKKSADDKKYYLQEKEYKLLVDPYYFKEMINNYSTVIAQNCTNNLFLNLKKKIKILLARKQVKSSFEFNLNKYYLQAIKIIDSSRKIILLNAANDSLTEINIKENLEKDKFITLIYNDIFKKTFKNIKEEKYLNYQLEILYNNIYSYGTYTSFYTDKKYPETDSLELLTLFLKSILKYKAKKNSESTKKILNEFLNDEYYYFKKMSVYIIGQNIKDYKDIFWNVFTNKLGQLIISEIYFADELKHLFESLEEIPNDKKKKLEDIIEQGPNVVNLSAEERENYIKLWKQKRYKALSSDIYFKNKYQNLKNESNKEVELRPGIGEVKVEWNSDNSPLKQEEIMQLSNEELSNFILEFKPTNNWDAPTHEGLARNVNAIAQRDPDKFIENLEPFLKVGYIYIYNLLSGITKAWKDKTIINWNKLFNFIKKYLDQDGFWNDEFKVAGDQWNFSYLSVIGQLGLLIQAGTNNDDWAFETKYINCAASILFKSIDNLEKEDMFNDEAVTKSINTAFGKVTEALLNLSLRDASLNAKTNNGWRNDLKTKYQEVLTREIEEAYTLFGLHLANFYYLDSQWTKDQIKNFEDLNYELWNSFMAGYLFNPRIKEELYNLMSTNYLRALNNSLDKNYHKNLIRHITFSYLFNENKKDDLFSRLLVDWNKETIIEIIGVLWSDEKYILNKNNSEIIIKIMTFWNKLYNKYKSNNNFADEEKSILSDSIKLMVFINELDDDKSTWIKMALPFLQFEYNEAIFVKELFRITNENKSIETLGYIAELLSTAPILRYRLEKINFIVEAIFETEDAQLIKLGRRICDKYSRAGVMHFKDLYERYDL